MPKQIKPEPEARASTTSIEKPKKKRLPKQPPIKIGKDEVNPGQRLTINLPIADLYTSTALTMPIQVLRGKRRGPVMFVSAAIHGDEINGVEIIRRLLGLQLLNHIKGTLIAVPVVNVFGFLNQSRYLPDRRDLNRSFPGSEKGSLAGRLAHLFMTEIVAHCTHGIDLHTGSNHRTNLPQIRACIDEHDETLRMAQAFGAPVIMHSDLRDGSLRASVDEKELPVIVYEAGEALRFDELAIRFGVRGIISVMRTIGMLPKRTTRSQKQEPLICHSSSWVRAPHSGLLRTSRSLGNQVSKGEKLGTIAHPLGRHEMEVISPRRGVIIGQVNLPLVNEGDAVFHIASYEKSDPIPDTLDVFDTDLSAPDT